MRRTSKCSLLPYNTFGIDQRCDELITYETVADAMTVARELQTGQKEQPLLILGGGSNLLLTDDFHGCVVTADKRFEVEVLPGQHAADEVYVRCWAGTTFDDVVAYAVEHGCYGMENLSLIPGECGASAVQNIGAYGVEAKDFITSIEAVELATGRVVTIPAEHCGYGYRQSRFKQEWRDRYLVTYVTYRLSKTFVPHLDYGNVRSVMAERGIGEQELTPALLRQLIIDIRRAKLPDPAELGNAGSFFMNPVVDEPTLRAMQARFPDIRYFEVRAAGDDTDRPSANKDRKYKIPAGWMIEQCGWKGKSMGPAGVYEKQALVLVNRGGARGVDVVALMKQVQQDVFQKFGLLIQPEVNIR